MIGYNIKLIIMKTRTILFMLLAGILFFSCSKDNADDDPGIERVSDFFAIINGGTFSFYESTLDFYTASSEENTLTITSTDINGNTIRLFGNSSGGVGAGTIKVIGDVDDIGFVTTVVVRDAANMVTYNSISGDIVILENVVDPSDSDYRFFSGNFDIILNAEGASASVTLEGDFTNIRMINSY